MDNPYEKPKESNMYLLPLFMVIAGLLFLGAALIIKHQKKETNKLEELQDRVDTMTKDQLDMLQKVSDLSLRLNMESHGKNLVELKQPIQVEIVNSKEFPDLLSKNLAYDKFGATPKPNKKLVGKIKKQIKSLSK